MNTTNGVSLILTSAFFYATYGIWSRLMVNQFGEFTQAWTRGLFLFCLILVINRFWPIFKSWQKVDFPWLLLIALAGGLNQAPYYLGFKYLTIGTATLFFYAALVIGGYLLGIVFFKERLDKIKIISLGLALTGLFYIYSFELQVSQIPAALLTLVAGLLGSIAVIMPRKLKGGYPEFQIMICYFTTQVIINGILGYIFNESIPSFRIYPIVWLAQAGYALAMLLANWAAIEGYRHFDASIGSLLGLAEIIFGLVFGAILFGEGFTSGMMVGAILIIVSAALPHILAIKLQNSSSPVESSY
jgi:drug/metabolite transporter (DMT)-like permease